MTTKRLECPHCQGPVPVTPEELDSAAAVLVCPSCKKRVYLAMGRVSNFQPDGEGGSYDSGD